MSLTPAIVDALVASGVTVEQLAAAVKASLADQEVRARSKREADAERQRKSRANRGTSRNVTVTPRDKYDTPPNEYILTPHEPLEANASSPPLAEKVVEAWNDGPAKRGATAAKSMDAGRRKALTARVREHGEPAVFEAIRNLAASDWHCGRNDNGWRANLGWLLKSPENFQKALELAPTAQSSPGQTSFAAHVLGRNRPTIVPRQHQEAA